MNWNGIKNGLLLTLMLKEGFEVLITFDKNLQFQQNFKKYPIPVIVLNEKDNTYLTLTQISSKILELLKGELKAGANLIHKKG